MLLPRPGHHRQQGGRLLRDRRRRGRSVPGRSARLVSSEAVTGRVGRDGDADGTVLRAPATSTLVSGTSTVDPGGDRHRRQPLGREARVAGDDLDLGAHHVRRRGWPAGGCGCPARSAGRAARCRARARAGAAATRACVRWVARSVRSRARRPRAGRGRPTTWAVNSEPARDRPLPRSSVIVLWPGIGDAAQAAGC